MKNTKLKAARIAMGLTQVELSNRVGIMPYPQISYIESGRLLPTPEVAEAIAEVLAVPTHELFPELNTQQNERKG